ncbi:MAG: hypothetical protein AB7H90_01295 [Alphaproteobacteria bacterium]
MILNSEHTEARARDALAFEPLPESPYLTIDRNAIYVSVRYSEPLSRLLRRLPYGEWEATPRRWRYQFRAADAIREALPEIERLAGLARDKADKETERREEARKEAASLRQSERDARERRRAATSPCALRPEYLAVVPDRPRYALTLEAIGDDARGAGLPSRCWVAQIFGHDGRDRWVKAYLAGVRDYTGANSVGSRGIAVVYHLSQGPIYEVSSPTSWRNTDRYFLRVIDGRATRLDTEDVTKCLAR